MVVATVKPEKATASKTKVKVEKPASKTKVKVEKPASKAKPATMAEPKAPRTAGGKKAAKKADGYGQGSEFGASWMRPSQEECLAAHAILEQEYGPREAPKGDPNQRLVLDALVGTILSQNTTDKQSRPAFLSLKTAFPRWDQVLAAPAGAAEEAVRSAGLADIKMERVRRILAALRDEGRLDANGDITLEFLRGWADDDIKRYLGAMNGVGPKTVSCVLLFAMQRADFPVDAHVWKLALALRWVPPSADRDSTYRHLNSIVPDAVKFSLHVLLVHHGKVLKNALGPLAALAKSGATATADAVAAASKGAAAVTSAPPVQPEEAVAGSCWLSTLDKGKREYGGVEEEKGGDGDAEGGTEAAHEAAASTKPAKKRRR